MTSSERETNPTNANGFALCLLVRDLERALKFHRDVLGLSVELAGAGEAVVRAGGSSWRLRADARETVPALREIAALVVRRGAGVELRVEGRDPAAAEARAREHGFAVLVATRDVGGGAREAHLVDADGYVWVASARA